MRPSLLLCVVLLSTGCAASAPVAADSTSVMQTETEAKRERTYATGAAPQPLAHDPYAERPGAKEQAPAKPEPRVTFEAPTGKARRPLPRAEHPELNLPARVAIVSVRDGEIEDLPRVVLSLEKLLRKETEIKAVLSLGAPRLASVGLEELAAQAKAEGRDLLLVDVRPGSAGIKRTGYLLHAGTGALLARYDVREDPEGAEVSDDADVDLCARLGPVYTRLKD